MSLLTCQASRSHHLLLPSLLNPLPHLLRLPIFLRSRPRMGRHHRILNLPFHRRRNLPLLHLHRSRYTHPHQPHAGSFRQVRSPRSASSTHDDRLRHPTHRSLLVRLDLVPRHPSRTSDHLRRLHRHGDLPCVLASTDLHHRRLPHERQQRSGSHRFRAGPHGRRLSFVCDVHV